MNKLTESHIGILTNFYVRSFDVWEAWGNLCNILEKHGNQRKCYIYTALCKHMVTILENYDNKFVFEMNPKKTIHYLMKSIEPVI